MSILMEIVQKKKQEIAFTRERIPLQTLLKIIESIDLEEPRSLLNLLKHHHQFHLICEIKKTSPTGGIINRKINPVKQARSYQRGGATAISILTEKNYFEGSAEIFKMVRPHIDLPLLRKDFIIDEYQIFESKVLGADIILLIAKILNETQIHRFLALAKELRMEVLFELYDVADLEKIPDPAPHLIIGINNRDLRTFKVDVQHSIQIKKRLPVHYPVIAESGISTPMQCQQLYAEGFSGALIGETFMRAENPEVMIRSFLNQLKELNDYPA